MKRNLLAATIGAVFAVAMAPGAVFAQNTPDPDPESDSTKDASEFETIRVTGSLIPQAQKETASPVTIITAEQIERQGFRNVYDALRSQPLATSVHQRLHAGREHHQSARAGARLHPDFVGWPAVG